LIDHGQISEALTHFEVLSIRYPSVPKFEAATGVALTGLGRYREAEPHLRRAVANLQGSDQAVMRLNLAGTLIQQRRLEEGGRRGPEGLASWPSNLAFAHLEREVAATPRKPVVRLALAEPYRGLGQATQEAEQRATLAKLDPELARAAVASLGSVPGR